jgi:4-hydroxybenzoate polyprenyltransferase
MKAIPEGLRTLLILGRVSNLPTVWSNLLAGWILQEGGTNYAALGLLLTGGSFLYVGGMYLNDFCDAEFDARYCPQRPIPAGKISRNAVGTMAALWFGAGLVCLAILGFVTAGLALLLTALIVLYDFRHKNVAWAPLIMGACRFLLYPLGALAVALSSIDELAFDLVPSGLGLGLYVAGITYLARGESRPGKPARWALLLLLSPVAISLALQAGPGTGGPFLPAPLILAGILQLFWMAWLLVPFWRKTNPSLGRVVSGLLAGIVLVDMVAATRTPWPPAFVLFPFFILALLLQRFIPAT